MGGQAHSGWSPRVRRAQPAYERRLAEHSWHGSGLLFGQEDFTVRCTRERDRQVVAACGQLDLSTAWQLERELRRAEAADVDEILVDLSGLEFIDSVGMEVLIHSAARSHRDGNRLMIKQGPRAVHRAFELSGLVSRLPFVGPGPAATT
jgi:anti-sigma B factor antagonist